MVQNCSVPLCKKAGYRIENNRKVTFHSFPRDNELRNEWCHAIQRHPPDFNIRNYTKVCSLHFLDEDFDNSNPFRSTRRLKHGAVPSLFPWTQPAIKTEDKSEMQTTSNMQEYGSSSALSEASAIPRKRKADQSALKSIQKQTEYCQANSYDTDSDESQDDDGVTPNKVIIKKEPDEQEKKSTYTWKHSPMEDEEIEKNNDTETTEASSLAFYTAVTPIILPKVKQSTSFLQQEAVKPSPTEIEIEKTVNEKDVTGQVCIQKSPNMKVKMIKSCSKCAPIVLEMAHLANKASQSNRELKRSMHVAKNTVDNLNSVRLLLHQSQEQNKELENDIATLNEKSRSFSEKVFSSDMLMQMFCGISSCSRFNWIFKVVSSLNVTVNPRLEATKLSDQEQVLLTIMYLRSNPTFEEIVYRFQFRITPGEVSEVLVVWLPLLAKTLKARIVEFPKCILNTNFPPCLESIGRNFQGIVHRFEITRKTPPIWDVGQTSHCLKCLVAFSPKGSIMRASQVVDQSVSDFDIFVKSRINKLFGATNIFVDTQAIGLQDHVQFGTKVLEPPFGNEIGKDAFRHIETMIKRLMDYRILEGPVCHTVTKPMMDSIVIICSALVNLQVELE